MYFNGSEGACRSPSGPLGMFSLALCSHTAPSGAGGTDCHFLAGEGRVRSQFTEELGPERLTLKIFQTVQRDAAARFLLT